MRFGVLGSLLVEGVVLPRSRMQRLLLAMLLSRANEPVSSDLLIEEMWEGEPPRSARTNLQVYVHRLRRAIGEDRVVHRSPGYVVVVGPGEFDVDDFERAVAAGRQASDRAAAAEAFAAGLGLWRGSAYEGLADHPFLRDEAARLNELRLATIEDRFEVDLALGRHGEAVAELTALVRRFPLRERLCGQLMLALYRSGRSPDALEVYRRARERLIEEIGVEPGSELQRRHEAILRADPALELTAPEPSRIVPAELPPGARTFTGRRQEIAEVSDRLRSDTGSAPAVVAIDGSGGIGKSTLAVQVGHAVADRFPGGQLYVNLRAATPGITPLSPAEALARLLRSLGLDDAAIPTDVDEAAARFRSLTAERRVLVILDDAADVAQIRALIPGAGCAVLITSRLVLATLDGATHLHVDALSEDEAATLLGELAGADRVRADPEAAAEIVRFCGYLPLAVRIAGARLAARPDWQLATLARRLDDEQARLDELEHADLAVRASCALSYRALPVAAADLFALLGTLELPDLTVPVAAVLVDLPVHQTRRRLDQLVDAQLLNSDGDRYTLHDLVRLYAREQAEELDSAVRSAAVERVLHHYLATARTAMRRIRPNPARRLALGLSESETTAPGLDIPDAAAATAWAAAESANLVAVARHAANRPGDGPAIAVGLATSLFQALESNSRWMELIAVNQIALAAIGTAGPSPWRSMVHGDLGTAYIRLGRFPDAQRETTAALAAARESGDERGAAAALDQLGTGARIDGRLEEAFGYFEQALAEFTALEDKRGQGVVLNNIATVHFRAGRYSDATPYCEQAVAIFTELGDRWASGTALTNLGRCHAGSGRAAQAVAIFEEALGIFRVIGHRPQEATALWRLGMALRDCGRSVDAREHWRRALDLLCDLELMTEPDAEAILADPPQEMPEFFQHV